MMAGFVYAQVRQQQSAWVPPGLWFELDSGCQYSLVNMTVYQLSLPRKQPRLV